MKLLSQCVFLCCDSSLPIQRTIYMLKQWGSHINTLALEEEEQRELNNGRAQNNSIKQWMVSYREKEMLEEVGGAAICALYTVYC